MPKVKVVFSRVVEVEVPVGTGHDRAIQIAEKELNDLIMQGNFFISDMEVDIED